MAFEHISAVPGSERTPRGIKGDLVAVGGANDDRRPGRETPARPIDVELLDVAPVEMPALQEISDRKTIVLGDRAHPEHPLRGDDCQRHHEGRGPDGPDLVSREESERRR